MKKLLLSLMLVSNSISMFATQGPITLQVWGGIDHDDRAGIHDTTKGIKRGDVELFEDNLTYILINNSPFEDEATFELLNAEGDVVLFECNLLQNEKLINISEDVKNVATQVIITFRGTTYKGQLK